MDVVLLDYDFLEEDVEFDFELFLMKVEIDLVDLVEIRRGGIGSWEVVLSCRSLAMWLLWF